MVKNEDDIDYIIMKINAEIESQSKARNEAKDRIKYPLNEYPNYDIIDIVTIFMRHKNKKITDKFIEQVLWELKS